MSKEVKMNNMPILERLKKTMELFQRENKCAVMFFVAYTEKVDGKEVIQIQLSDYMPSQIVPNCLQLLVHHAEALAKPEQPKEDAKDEVN